MSMQIIKSFFFKMFGHVFFEVVFALVCVPTVVTFKFFPIGMTVKMSFPVTFMQLRFSTNTTQKS